MLRGVDLDPLPHASSSPTRQRRPREFSTNGNRSDRRAKSPWVKRDLRLIARAHDRAETLSPREKRSGRRPCLRRSSLMSLAIARR